MRTQMQSASTQPAYPLHDLTAFKRDLLRLVERLDEPSGLDIKADLEAEYDTDEINHGRLYPNLDDLVDKGFIEKGQQDKRTNYYRITDRGVRELDAHRAWLTGADDE